MGSIFIIVPNRVLVKTKFKIGGKILNESKFSDFGLAVKTELLHKGKTQKWLEEEVTKRTGLYLDRGYVHKILTGQRNAPKIVSAICEILDIKKEE